jgi:tetratricopeptide (TPR) repeat protein
MLNISHFLPALRNLACMAVLLTFPWKAISVPSFNATDPSDIESLMLELPGFSTTGAAPRQAAAPLNNKDQARSAVNRLQTELRETGELRNIITLAPRLMELLPEDTGIRNMYALALTARDDVATASKLAATKLNVNDSSDLYALLAFAAMAKASGDLDGAASAASRAIAIVPEHPYAYNLLGQVYISRNDYTKALDHFQAATEHAPRFVAAWSNLGAVQFLRGESGEAWLSFSKAIELSPGFCAPRIGRAAISTAQGDSANAISDLEACLESQPGNLRASRQLAHSYLMAGRLGDAEKIAQTHLSSDEPYFNKILADIYLRQDQAGKAIKHLRAIARPDSQTHYLMSFAEMFEGNPKGAVEHIQQALALQPGSATLEVTSQIYAFYSGAPVERARLVELGKDPAVGQLALYLAGNMQASDNNIDKAYKYWNEAGNLLPGFTLKGVSTQEISKSTRAGEQKYLALGLLYYLKGFYPASLSEFNKALSINPKSIQTNYFAALASVHAADNSKTRKYLEQSLKSAPGFFPANYLLAELLVKQGEIDAAIKHYNAAADTLPDAGVLVKLGLLYDQKGNRDDAAQAYRKFIAHYPDNFIGYNQLAWMYTRDGVNLMEALELAKKADKLRPDNASVNDTLGWIYFQNKDYKQAEKYLQHANDISNGNNPDILFHLASLKKAQGDTSTAKLLVEKALKTKNFESASEARKLQRQLQRNQP